MTKLENGITKKAICRDCKQKKLVNLDNQCFDCWNLKRHIKEAYTLNHKWRKRN